MKKIIIPLSIASLAVCLTSCGKNSSKVVNVYNWGDFIDETVIDKFEEETGYEVIYNMYETPEDMYTKIVNSKASYDVVITSDYMLERMASEGLLSEVDLSAIPEYKNIDDSFKNLSYDPENKYTVPYMWGTMGILYNKTMVNGEIKSWKELWNEEYSGSILMLNSQRDTIGITLKMLGHSLNSLEEAHLEEAKQVLIDQSPLVLAYVVDEGKDKMISGEAALSLAWAGDAVYCMSENDDLDYVIPEEGSNMFFDSMAIPSNHKNKAGAQAFINFMCKPEISALNAQYIGYSTPSSAARELMGEDGQNPVAYPDVTQHNLEIFKNLGDNTKIYDKIWTEITSSF